MKLTSTALSIAALSSTAVANLGIGILSGEGISGGAGAGPALQKYQTGFVAKDGQSICDADPITIDVGTDPSGPWWNLCGEDLSPWCGGKKIEMRKGDSCGKNVAGDQPPGDGFFYADLIDTGADDKVVGRCVFEMGKNKDCVSNGSYIGHVAIKCYTDACG